MIYAYFDDGNKEIKKDVIYYAPSWFDGNYFDEWLYDPYVINLVKEVDNSDLIGHNVISPVLGSISVRDLSGGVKTIICMYKEPELIYAINHCGDNCAKYILDIGKKQDINIFVNYLIDFCGEFEMKCMNNNVILKNEDEYRCMFYDLCL